jgi:hypothetical protein
MAEVGQGFVQIIVFVVDGEWLLLWILFDRPDAESSNVPGYAAAGLDAMCSVALLVCFLVVWGTGPGWCVRTSEGHCDASGARCGASC